MYGKVYKSMFHGSMYGNPDGIITMMVLIALADREGYVDMTPQAIAASATISVPRTLLVSPTAALCSTIGTCL